MGAKKPVFGWLIFSGVAVGALALTAILAQQPPDFAATADANNDGVVTREELRAVIGRWMPSGAEGMDQQQLASALSGLMQSTMANRPAAAAPGEQNQTPNAADVERMLASIPAQAPARPGRARKVLVLSKCAGFVHSCIPLVGKTVEALGARTGAWATTVSYDPSAITEQNLRQYDAVLLNNTTGSFLDDAHDPGVTAARKKALLDFVRSGKGLVGIHAAADSYHQADPSQTPARPAGAGSGRGTGPNSGRGAGFNPGSMLAASVISGADKDGDGKLSAQELSSLADAWYDKLDAEKSGRLTRQNLSARLNTVLSVAPARPAPAVQARQTPASPVRGRQGRDNQVGTWPEFNVMIGAFFKWHWMDPQHVVYRIDDPDSPLTTMFKNLDFSIDDETYTFGINSWSRQNLHVLTSVDYAKMSEEDKLKEDYPREDHDYGLSWIRREGQGRVFYEAHGHNEKVYAIRPMLEHILAGVQYALGDLKANDAPSAAR